MKITWFRHDHENRNDLLRFGFMRLELAKEIEYKERPFKDAFRFGFNKALLEFPDIKHLSFILFEKKGFKVKCIVDSEDSFVLVSPLIEFADLYLCAGYNADFFERKKFIAAYRWQDENDLAWYKETLEKKILLLGDHFYKTRRFIPIAPNLTNHLTFPLFKRKLLNMENRFNIKTGRGMRISDDLKAFEIRYAYLQSLRQNTLNYDIVLNDSLWGWPRHRINLHKNLAALKHDGYKIHSILKWGSPVEYDGSCREPQDPMQFPMVTSEIDGSYEVMLASSRLAVFACGFHWGWRNIMMLALMAGIPVLTDRLITEAYFDMKDFYIKEIEDHDWLPVEYALKEIPDSEWLTIKKRNQGIYDKYMSPEAVASYFIRTAESA
jgi:hypothetical protein